MTLNEWAIKWGIQYAAVEDLRKQLTAAYTTPAMSRANDSSETANQILVRLEASRQGAVLWRNNVGAMVLDNGSFIRYGLANDSAEMNKRIKSSDLIGIRPVIIMHHHIGSTIGQFVAREIKPGNWNYSGNDRERAQLKFLELVMSLGGDAAFAKGEGTL